MVLLLHVRLVLGRMLLGRVLLRLRRRRRRLLLLLLQPEPLLVLHRRHAGIAPPMEMVPLLSAPSAARAPSAVRKRTYPAVEPKRKSTYATGP